MTRQGNLIGKQLSKLRNERGLSQLELSAICQRVGWDVSREVIARIEGGVRGISDRELAVLATALSTQVEKILTPAVIREWIKSIKAAPR